MSDTTQFDLGDKEQFYIIVSETNTVYETLSDAGDDIEEKFEDDEESFIARARITDDGGDGISLELNQVERAKLVRALTGGDISEDDG
jgi:hypothetical protein